MPQGHREPPSLAALYETLRLYTIVPAIKWTGDHPTTLGVGSKTLSLSPKTIVLPSYSSMHTDPWYCGGSDALQWRPPALDQDRRRAWGRGLCLGWAEDTRDCPGKKFSQVEFVALMVGLFWR